MADLKVRVPWAVLGDPTERPFLTLRDMGDGTHAPIVYSAATGGSGAPTDAGYIVTTAHSALSAEVVAGATPGGELGGTWDAPTVDATHSGSSHAGVIAAHEASASHGAGSIPAGIIAMWGGFISAIPSGWLLCDGANGTPDLRGMFIKGAVAGSNPGATGGAATHGHTVTQPDAHTFMNPSDHSFGSADILQHTHSTDSQGAHVHDEYRNGATTGGLDGWGAGDTSTNNPTLTGYDTGSNGAHTHTAANPAGSVASFTKSHSGGGVSAHAGAAVDTVNNEPAYYSLAYIQKA